MSSKRKEVSKILKKHNVSFDGLADEESLVDVRSVLFSVDEKYVLFSMDVTEPGGCGEEIDEFYCSILRDIAARSEGKVSIKNIKSNTETDEDGEEMVNISFDHESNSHSWTFETDYPEEFYDGVMDWLQDIVGEGYHDNREEILWAWKIDAQALRDLKLLFLETPADDIDEDEYDKNGIIHLVRIQAIATNKEELELEEVVKNEKCAELLEKFEEENASWMIVDNFAIVFHFTPLKATQEGNIVSAGYPVLAAEHAPKVHEFLGQLFEMLGIELQKNWQMETITWGEYNEICDSM